MERSKWTFLIIMVVFFIELSEAKAYDKTGPVQIGTVQAAKIGICCSTPANSEVGKTQSNCIGNAKPVLINLKSYGIGYGKCKHEPKYYYYDHGYPYYYYYWPYIRPYRYWPYYHGLYFGFRYYY